MPTKTDEPAAPRATTGIFTTLRGVLFETTSSAPAKVSAKTASSADVEAARATLRQSVEAELGPGVREFALQVEALREVLPDPAQRQRAALRVLELKGVSTPTLVAELEQAISRLSQQGDAFAAKLSARNAALEQQRSQAVEACRVETAEAEQTIARLQNELEAARAQLTAADSRRAQAMTACDESAARLAQKQHGFERAFSELHGEYTSLRRQLANAESI
jgi:chromosome segregation ATPase